MTNDFEMDFISDVNRDNLRMEISFRKQRLCQISKDKGTDLMEIEFLSDLRVLPYEVVMRFSLDEFERTLIEARAALGQCP